jgi:hypothetical protein
MQSPYKSWGPLAAATTVGVVLVGGLILSICTLPGYSGANHQPAPSPTRRLIPAGKFKKVHSLLVQEVDGDFQDNLAASTCFVPAGASSDAVLHVELYLLPPSGMQSGYTMADTTMVYKATVTNAGKRIWSATESTSQPVTFAPGIHPPPGTTWHKDVSPHDAKLLLLRDLRWAGCADSSSPAKD